MLLCLLQQTLFVQIAHPFLHTRERLCQCMLYVMVNCLKVPNNRTDTTAQSWKVRSTRELW